MKSLYLFAQIWNTENIATQNVEASDEYVEDMKRVLSKYIDVNEDNTVTRMSAMGKPLIERAYRKVKPIQEQLTFAEMWVISMGDFAEALIVELMSIAGIAVTHYQQKVDALGIIGHIDGVVDNTTVFDIKCMSTTYFKSFTNKPNNDRGYLTQLALYQYALKLPKAAFLCLDKTTGQMKVVKLPKGNYLDDVVRKLRILEHIESEDDIIRMIKPEPPKEGMTGLVVPDNMQHSNYARLIYGDTYHVNEAHYRGKWNLTKDQ